MYAQSNHTEGVRSPTWTRQDHPGFFAFDKCTIAADFRARLGPDCVISAS